MVTPPDKPAHPIWGKRWVRVFTILGCVAALAASAPFLYGAVLRLSLESEARTTFETQQAELGHAHEAKFSSFQNDVGVSSAPVYSVEYAMCYTDHSDSGWFANNYNYKCQVSYVDVMEAPASQSLKTATAAWAQKSGARNGYVSFTSDEYRKALGMSPNQSWRHFYVTVPGEASDARTLMDARIVASGVITYAADDAFDKRLLVTETGRPELDPRRQYVIHQMSDEYLRRNIGCAPVPSLFCVSPIGE